MFLIKFLCAFMYIKLHTGIRVFSKDILKGGGNNIGVRAGGRGVLGV